METQQTHRNTFEGGLNTDITKNLVNANQFLDAKNLSLVGDGTFLSLQDKKGTTKLETIIATNNTTVLGVYATRYTIGTDENVNCLTIFTVTVADAGFPGTFYIYAYDIDNDALYQLYSEDAPPALIGVANIPSLVDAVLYPENGLDILYFTDYLNRPRKIRCEIPTGYAPDFLNILDLDLLKRQALGTVDFESVSSGGSLLTGTYQIAYQMLKPETNKYTRFSLLTNPIHIFTTVNGIVSAGIGLASDKRIKIDINPTEDEVAYYTHFRLAIVENVGAVPDSQVNVGLTKTYPISDLLNFYILSNTQFSYTTIDEIVIDLAAIERVKTIAVRENRMLFGNVELASLEYDQRLPEVGGGSILIEKGDIGYSNATQENFQSKFKGYFRDEVYRFGISYFDEYGNYSSAKTLDTILVTGNQYGGGFDMKFPAIQTIVSGTYYSLQDSDSRIKAMGLRLTGIDNHPTWAKGFVILRAKRKKKILFQTPVLPMTKLVGLGAVGKYPTERRETSSLTTVTDTALTPMGPSAGFIPYNMFYGAATKANGYTTTAGGAGVSTYQIGESSPLIYTGLMEKAMIFPPQAMYENNAYAFTGSEVASTVDAVLCKTYFYRFDSESYNPGLGINSSVSGSFYAVENSYRYYNEGHGGAKAALRSATVPIANARAFDNYGEGAFVGAFKAHDYNLFKTPALDFGGSPFTHKSTVVDFVADDIGSPNAVSIPTFAAGAAAWKATTSSPYGIALDTSEFLWSTTGSKTDRNNILEICNIVSNLDDQRYGAEDDYNEFIYTGTKRVFTNSEVASSISVGASLPVTVDIWGGDCIISPHTFKISDTTFTMINQPKLATGTGVALATLGGNFGKVWLTSGDAAVLTMPAYVQHGSQYLTVILESEYNGSVNDVESLVASTTVSGYDVKGTSTESGTSVPRNYNYNINLNKENNQKIFVPVDETIVKPYLYKARVYYSDLKVYQTDIDGFDSVRVLNYIDLEETYGQITKLSVVGDRLFSLQERGISILPVGERVIETTDTSQLAVRSGEFLAPPVYIDTIRGCQYIGSVQNTGKVLFFLDRETKSVNTLDGSGQLQTISGKGLTTELRQIFPYNSTPEGVDSIKSFYDIHTDQYFLSLLGSRTYIWNNGLQLWEPKQDWTFGGGARVGNRTFLVAQEDTTFDTCIYEYGTGLLNHFMGTYVTPYVQFVSNPMGDFSKVYDSLLVNANGTLASGEVRVERQSGTQIAATQAFSTQRGEGNWKVKILRDQNGPVDGAGAYKDRLRGPYALVKLTWNAGAPYTTPVTVSSVLTKYTPSFNIF